MSGAASTSPASVYASVHAGLVGATPVLPTPRNGYRPKSQPRRSSPRPRKQLPDRNCFVYLFVHGSKPQFKIGVSLTPLSRLAQLEEAQSVDVSRSMVVRLPTVKRAREVESLLHKAMSHQRITPNALSRHDGDTEWFQLSALPLAMQLIVDTPALSKSASLRIEPLSAYADQLDYGPLDVSGINHQLSLLTHNLEVVRAASQLLLRISQSLAVTVYGLDHSVGPGAAREQYGCGHPTIVLHQFRHYGQPNPQGKEGLSGRLRSHLGAKTHAGSDTEHFLLRLKVMDLDGYRLLRLPSLGSDRQVGAAESLIQMISYGQGSGVEVGAAHSTAPASSSDIVLDAGPDDLVIQLASSAQLLLLPGGKQLCLAVQALVSQLGLMSLTEQRAQTHALALSSRAQLFPDLELDPRHIRRARSNARPQNLCVH